MQFVAYSQRTILPAEYKYLESLRLETALFFPTSTLLYKLTFTSNQTRLQSTRFTVPQTTNFKMPSNNIENNSSSSRGTTGAGCEVMRGTTSAGYTTQRGTTGAGCTVMRGTTGAGSTVQRGTTGAGCTIM